MKIQMNGKVHEGTAEEILESIRKNWWWEISTEELFKIASGFLKQPIKTAKDYVSAMVKIGAAKEISA